MLRAEFLVNIFKNLFVSVCPHRFFAVPANKGLNIADLVSASSSVSAFTASSML